jgi:hypothetical protein
MKFFKKFSRSLPVMTTRMNISSGSMDSRFTLSGLVALVPTGSSEGDGFEYIL